MVSSPLAQCCLVWLTCEFTMNLRRRPITIFDRTAKENFEAQAGCTHEQNRRFIKKRLAASLGLRLSRRITIDESEALAPATPKWPHRGA